MITTTTPEITTTTRKTAPFGPIGQQVYDRTYSRPLPAGGNESWHDTVDRVVAGNTGIAFNQDDYDGLRDLMDDFRLLPAGRHLWVTGVHGVPNSSRRNCFRAPFTSRLADHFEFTGSMLLLGGGVGANYSLEYLERALPINPTISAVSVLITCRPSHKDYGLVKAAAGDLWIDRGVVHSIESVVDDSREGWVSAWGACFDTATNGGYTVLDLSDVRPAGAPILTFGGTASGPAPLASSIRGIMEILATYAGRKLTGIGAMDCDHAIASAVVAGGARRSARMSIMHWNDPYIWDFLRCKRDPSKNWTTNISVEVDDEFFAALDQEDRGSVGILAGDATAVLNAVVDGMIMNGEPGFYNVSLASVGETGDVRATNPCGEISLEITDEGGGESCNIGSVNLDAIGTDDVVALDAFLHMTRFLIRQTVPEVDHEPSRDIENRNRRIGVGFLGLQGWAAAHGVKFSEIPSSDILRTKLRMFRSAIRAEADRYAAEIGIPSPIKVTAIAPNGTISHIPGTQPGAHPILMRYGIRNVRYTTGDPRISEALDQGLVVEACVYADNTWVVSYPMTDPLMARFSPEIVEDVSQVSVSDQFAVLAMVTEEFCGGSDGNAVSFTASFDPDSISYSEMVSAVRTWLPKVKGMTAFPSASRPQAPYIPISEKAFLALTDRGGHDTGDTGDEDLTCSALGGCPIR